MRQLNYKTRFCLLLLAGCGPMLAADVTGDWKVEGAVTGNPVALVCSLKQEDAKLTGKCVSSTNGINAPVTGKVDGRNITFQFDFDYNGMALTMAFAGANDVENAIKGSIEVAGVEGSFTAAKQVATP